ncbi:MAG: hypothetical protein GXO42_02205 [bacterium]|nr:hypothetical protein [bacterium]
MRTLLPRSFARAVLLITGIVAVLYCVAAAAVAFILSATSLLSKYGNLMQNLPSYSSLKPTVQLVYEVIAALFFLLAVGAFYAWIGIDRNEAPAYIVGMLVCGVCALGSLLLCVLGTVVLGGVLAVIYVLALVTLLGEYFQAF